MSRDLGELPDLQTLDQLRSLVASAKRIAVFTGAGISTESGIPDYRSADQGLWNTIRPIPFDEFIGSAEERTESWRRRFDGDRVMERAEPNIGHRLVARLVERGRCHAVVTQNVDGLHQAAGVPASQVIELHGNATYARCLSCGFRYEMADLEREFRGSGSVGDCRACGGVIKAATISFGQAMPPGPMRAAEEAMRAADLCLTLGSSLSVYPAAGFPQFAKERGAGLAIINREPTPLDPMADVVAHRALGATLSAIVTD
ncbi:MAG: Sir2 family NAD-dependent protein deacetylase [Pseudomonadota bacterium]